MFEAYFDPDSAVGGNQEQHPEWDDLYNALKEHDSGRGGDSLDVCLTGKDSDLERCGQQGFDITTIDDDKLTLTIKLYKRATGRNVFLNLESKVANDEDAYDRELEAYMDQAQEIVCGFPFNGEFDGDDWDLSDERTWKVPVLVNDETGEVEVAKMVETIIGGFDEQVEDWDRECGWLDDALSCVAGWKKVKDGEYVDVPDKSIA